MSQDSIQRDTLIAAPPERVWALITEAEHLGRWFGDAGAEIDLRPGGALVLRWEKHGTVHGLVEAVEPHSRFVWRWAPFKAPGGKEPVSGNSTLVEFTLAASDDGTLLTVVESGFDSLDCGTDERVELFAMNTEGWGHETAELADYAAKAAV